MICIGRRRCSSRSRPWPEPQHDPPAQQRPEPGPAAAIPARRRCPGHLVAGDGVKLASVPLKLPHRSSSSTHQGRSAVTGQDRRPRSASSEPGTATRGPRNTTISRAVRHTASGAGDLDHPRAPDHLNVRKWWDTRGIPLPEYLRDRLADPAVLHSIATLAFRQSEPPEWPSHQSHHVVPADQPRSEPA